MVERRIEWRYVGLALVMTAILFTGVFMLGQELSKYKVDTLQNDISDLRTEQRSTFLTYRMADQLEGKGCSAQKILTQQNLQDLYSVREKVVQHKNARKIQDPRFNRLKKEYLTILLDNYLRRQRLEQECGGGKVKILYFYSDKCDACEGQGKILTQLRKEYDGEVLVYPLDADFELEPISFLERYYSIDTYPSVVIDGELREGFVNQSVLETEINRKINQTGKNSMVE